ncbi:MAG: hypothetical protein HYY06_22540 [Deltaproteobacteria bacterium]|nr:hypothetical protein [Deltaproteobacteria bacterium]
MRRLVVLAAVLAVGGCGGGRPEVHGAQTVSTAEVSGSELAEERAPGAGRLEPLEEEGSFDTSVRAGPPLPPPAPAPDGDALGPAHRLDGAPGTSSDGWEGPGGQRPARQSTAPVPALRPPRVRAARPAASGGVAATSAPPRSGRDRRALPDLEERARRMPAEPPVRPVEPAAEPAPGSAPSGDSRLADETVRPGLATSWGEARVSPARRVFFERASDAPFAVATFHYDDWSGVERMLSHGAARGAPVGPVSLGPGSGITVAIIDERGRPLPAYRVGGRVVVAGAAGASYSIRITNASPGNIEIVASVDGLDVVDGLDASTSKRGYIVGGWQTLTIEGFRTSIDAVAAFRFGGVGESYAARTTGSARNVGVIGVALFAQRVPGGWQDREVELRENATPYPADHFAGTPGP